MWGPRYIDNKENKLIFHFLLQGETIKSIYGRKEKASETCNQHGK